MVQFIQNAKNLQRPRPRQWLPATGVGNEHEWEPGTRGLFRNAPELDHGGDVIIIIAQVC